MKTLSKKAIIGYPAGVITGITYGLNPLFAVPLMNKGVAIESILFHANIDTVIENTRIVSNQMGYVFHGEHLHGFKGDRFIGL